MTVGTPCTHPGCDGTIDEDGYCGLCCLLAEPAPAAPSSPAAPSVPTAQPTPAAVQPVELWGAATGRPSVGRARPGPAAPAPDSEGLTTSTGERARRRGWSGTHSSGPTRGRLGAGLVDVPAVPAVDPAAVLLVDPSVPEGKRFCSTCESPVGRGRDGRPGREQGFCSGCRTPFSFTPKLGPGALVAGQYDVQGCLAHGGLGWVYLAIDRNVSDRWVVLKGLLNSGDTEALRAAMAERQFLAQVDHANIVKIYNFVEHPDEDGTPIGYIVMEYVGGLTLKQLLERRRGPDRRIQPVPAAQAIAFALETLPALGYLHAEGLVYCDLKPDNLIQYGQQLKVIDLGAVLRIDDRTSPLYITKGYSPPAIGVEGPSPSADLYTLGRTLMVLALAAPPVRDGRHAELPGPGEHPVLARYESLHRFLLRATDPEPEHRFTVADDMADQLSGVLREVLAIDDGRRRPVASTVFAPSHATFAPGLLATATGPGRPDPARVAGLLPVPLVDPSDPAAALVASAGAADRDDIARMMASLPAPSIELGLRMVRAHLDAGDPVAATAVLDKVANDEPDDWRLEWYRGLTALVAGQPDQAYALFDAGYGLCPGEVAPKLAMAAAAECGGRDDVAGRYYALAALTSPNPTDAAFGLARVGLRAGRRPAAVAALDTCPESSSGYVPAQLAAVAATLLGRTGEDVGEAELRAAASRVERLPLEPAPAHEVRATLLTAAVELVAAGHGPGPDAPALLGTAWIERDLRLALEQCLRTSARLTSHARERIALIDRANAVHPSTWR